MQYTSLVLAQEMPVDSLKMIVRGHFTRELPRAFTDVVFEVHLEGGISQEQLGPLAEEASRHCFVENTLAKAIPITTEVYLNGNRALTLTRGPQEG